MRLSATVRLVGAEEFTMLRIPFKGNQEIYERPVE